MDFENINSWCWLIPALVGIISAFFGYLIGKGGNKSVDTSGELKLLKDKNAKLQADLNACNNKLTTKTSTVTAAPASIKSAGSVSPSFNAGAAKAALGKSVKLDDLKVVEGIGPKIEQMFKAASITTWKILSETPVAKCQEILDGGGDRYKVHQPGSWPMQAKMAYEGKWTELAKWQDEHDYGKL